MELAAANNLPNDIDALKSALISAQVHAAGIEGNLASVTLELEGVTSALATERAQRSDDQALIAHLKLVIAKMQREKFGPRSEKSERLLEPVGTATGRS